MNLDEQDILNDYASRSLRYTADQDYISARTSYKIGLIEPFLWSSLHAVEKYLKATLLFNKHTTFKDETKNRGYGHKVCELLDAVERIDGLDLRLPDQSRSFIRYLNEYGENRYFDEAAYLEEHALDNLDETIWYVRRHCFYSEPYKEGNYRKISPLELEDDPKSYKLPGSDAFLEKVIRERLHAYPYLAWNNYFYGEEEYTREFIRNSQRSSSFISPSLDYWELQAYEILKEYVYFPKAIHQYFSQCRI